MLSLITDSIWKYIALAIGSLLVLICIYTVILKLENSSLTNRVTELESEKKLYEQAIEQAKENQQVKIEYVIKEVEVIKWRTKEKLVPIKEYVYDTNKTNCENSINVIRSSGF